MYDTVKGSDWLGKYCVVVCLDAAVVQCWRIEHAGERWWHSAIVLAAWWWMERDN